MSSQPKPKLTSAEYLAIERASSQKHEFYRGEMFLMSGASFAHNTITANVISALHNLLRDRECSVTGGDMRVKVDATGLYTYPDVVVTCEKPRFEDGVFDTLLNPQVLVEVLSKSTESYDRGKKFEHFRQIDSLSDFLLVSQDHAHVDRFSHDERGQWFLVDATGLDASIEIPSIDCRLPLAEVYAKVEFPPISEQEMNEGGLFYSK